MIHNHGRCGSSSLMGKTSSQSVCLIFTHQTHQNVKIRQAFRSYIYTHENRRARIGLWTIFSAGNDNFFLSLDSHSLLISLSNLEGEGGGGKSERGTFFNILLNSSKYCKEILQVYFKIIQDYFACLNPEMNKVLWIQ